MSDVSEAQKKLAKAGVFKGHHGLEGLADAQEFWDEQPYGTRLYYGSGIADYLHRDVLQSAIKILNGSCDTETKLNAICVAGVSAEAECLSLKQQLTALQAENDDLESYLDEVMTERDKAQDTILECAQLFDEQYEWVARIPGELPPNSGDLHDDLPCLIKELQAEKERLAEAIKFYANKIHWMGHTENSEVDTVLIAGQLWDLNGWSVAENALNPKHPTQEPSDGS